MSQRFEFRRELGRGGMGSVHEAFDCERQETVALKMLHRADPETIFQIKQEFRSLSEVVHPRLVSMYELLCEGDQWFFTMEYIEDAKSLTDYLREHLTFEWEASDACVAEDTSRNISSPDNVETRAFLGGDIASGTLDASCSFATSAISIGNSLAETVIGKAASMEEIKAPPVSSESGPRRLRDPADVPIIIALFRQVAEGVQELHRRHILHRDLKPGNVMVRADGSVRILDFGLAIAKPPDGISSARSEKGLSGTVAYMAPEQATSQPVSEASDWYALGVMLFEVLAGELPFSGAPGSILAQKLRFEAPCVASRAKDVPSELASLCDRLLRRDPSERPDGQQVLTALGALDAAESASPAEGSVFIGRTRYLDRLQGIYLASQDTVAIAHLHGRSGSGKSALMTRFVDSLKTQKEALVFRCRCYEQESVPYKSVDGLADEVASWLQQRTEDEQRSLMPQTVQALARMFPVFKSIPCIAQAENTSFGTADLTELRRLSYQALGDLLSGISRQCQLVLCIDDLQWGDEDGIEILGGALGQVNRRLLLLVTYRDEYTDISAALRALARMENSLSSLRVEDILVEPLTEDEARELIRLQSPQARSEEIDKLVQQAEGNPYFLEELARQFGSGARPHESRGVALDEILWTRIARLPDPEMRLLEMIAVSGQPIRLLDAQKASGLEHTPFSVLTSLRMHRLVKSSGAGLRDQLETYHDRIRETILARLPSDTRRIRHASLAFCLEASGEATADTLATHFEAGGEAEVSGKYYEIAAGESAQALAFSRAEEFYRKARTLVKHQAARTRITQCLIHLKTDLAQFPEAYALGREGLGELGLDIPRTFSPPAFVFDLAKSWFLFRGRPLTSILELPASTDSQHQARIALLAAIGKAAYQIRPELCIAVMLKIVNNSVLLGNTRDSAIGYMAVGAIFVGGILGRYDAGYEFGRVSLRLVEKFEADRIRAEVNFVVGYFGTSWKRPSQEAEALWQVAHHAGLDTRDLFHVGCASCATVMSQFIRGAELNSLARLTDEYLELLQRFGLKGPRAAVLAVRRTVDALREPETRTAENLSDLRGEASFGSRHIEHYAFLARMQEQYLFGEYEAALETGRQSARYMGDSKGMLHSTEHIFYQELSRMALVRSRGGPVPLGMKVSLNRGIRRFESWAKSCPENFLAKALVLRGEEMSMSGRLGQALERFEQSAEVAQSFEQTHVAALANRLMAQTVALQGHVAQSRKKLALAQEQYARWGATGYAQSNIISQQSVPRSIGR